MPDELRKRSLRSYSGRKQSQVEDAVKSKLRRKISDAYDVPEEELNKTYSNKMCAEWEANVRTANEKSSSIEEKCQLLTLFPNEMTKQQILNTVPAATKYLIDKSRKLKAANGVWTLPDPYTSNKLKESDVATALRYFLEDEMDCSIQSPNKKDVVTVNISGTKECVVKRYMTRSIRESYALLMKAHPDIKLGLTKFYTLRAKWVKIAPYRDQCVCAHCANFELLLASINNTSSIHLTKKDITALCMCANSSEACMLQECKKCPGAKILSARTLHLDPEEEIEIATWESGDLIKKTLSVVVFIKLARDCVEKYITHEHIKDIQRKAIWDAKSNPSSKSIVLHFDFAEHWSIVLPKQVQGYYWQKKQLSIFTCVATTPSTTKSFATISDDLRHDSAHAILALKKIVEVLEEEEPIFTTLTYISDGAVMHFKNRFQFYEMGESGLLSRWLFSASGHGKNACDGIGGLLKHHATLHNMREPANAAILTSRDFVSALTSKQGKTRIIDLTTMDLMKFREEMKKKWESVGSVPGLRSCHVWYKQPSEV
ncbi:unnamed protein product, partial [Ixodes persulcatus]